MTNTSDNNDTVISDTEIRLLISSEETNRDDNSHDNETATSTTNFTGKKLRALVAAAFTIVLLISLSIYHMITAYHANQDSSLGNGEMRAIMHALIVPVLQLILSPFSGEV